MKRFCSLFFILLLFLSACSPSSPRAAVRGMRSDCAFALCGEEGIEEYFGSSRDTDVIPASITKLVSIHTALELLSPDDPVTPGDEVFLPPAGASSAFVRPHHTLTVEMLIEGMLLPSGDDAAYALAAAGGRAIPGHENDDYPEAVAAFVEKMNRTARDSSCLNTHFTVPDGYDKENRSTLGDMAVLCRLVAGDTLVRKYASLASDEVTYASGHTNTWVNTNKQLDPSSKWYDPRVIGLKTGSLPKNYSLVTLVVIDGKKWIIGVFGAPSDGARYRDTRRIIRWIENGAPGVGGS